MLERNLSLDILKLILSFMIVGLHTGFLGEFSALGEFLTVNGFFRIAVPLFLLINGFYFHPVVLKNKHALWFKRVIILYSFWMLFYSYFWFFIPESTNEVMKLILRCLMGHFHLWYISGLIGAATILLVLKKAGSKILITATLITFILGILIQYAGSYHVFSRSALGDYFNQYWYHRNFLLFSFPYFCMGFLINKHSIHKKIPPNIASLLALLGLFLLVVESSLNYYQPLRHGGFDNFLSLILACPAIFIVVMNQKINGRNKNIALYSSAIFLIHPFFLTVLKIFTKLEASALTFSVIIISAAASAIIIKVNRKIHFIL